MATNQTEIVNDLVDNVRLLLSSDTSLESLKEIDLCVKQNRIDLESIELSKITGLEEALALKVNIAKNELKNFIVPAGMIFINPSPVIPEGFFECNGAEVSREEYSELFKVIGTTYGKGDETTTFNLPDLRGEFVRGFDNGRGVDIDRTIGSFQEDEFKEHSHSLKESSGKAGPKGINSSYLNDQGNTTGAIDSSGGSETRPRNIAMVYCIKY